MWPGSQWRGCGLAVVCVSLALAVALLLANPLFPTPLFFAAIVISTWYGGGTPGVVAVVLSAVALDFYFVPPYGFVGLAKPQTPYLFEFVLPALITCWFVKKRRLTETSLRRHRDELESTVRERQAELAHVTRMTTVGELGVSVAHEVNQPLMAVVLNGDACLHWLDSDPPNLKEAREAVGRMIEEGSRAGEIVRRIRALGKKSIPQRALVDLNDLIEEVASLLERELKTNHIVLRREQNRHLPSVMGDRVQLQQVIVNLVMNAIEAMGDRPGRPREITIRCEVQRPDGLIVAVDDTGPGIPIEDPEQMFRAFFTTKPDGLGMGLAISRTIIEAHGGRLWASNSPRGATFQFRLPLEAPLPATIDTGGQH